MPRYIHLLLLALLLPIGLIFADNHGENDAFHRAESAFLHKAFDDAERLLAPLAEQGHSRAQTYLGLMYLAGKGVERDFARAYALFAQAADKNEATAQLTIGMMYLHGYGREANRETAEQWLEKAAGQGNTTAIETLMKLRFEE